MTWNESESAQSSDSEEYVSDDDAAHEYEKDLKEYYGDSNECEQEDLTPDTIIQSACLTRWLILFFMTIQATYRLSDGVISHIFKFMKAFLSVLASVGGLCTDIAKAFLYTWQEK